MVWRTDRRRRSGSLADRVPCNIIHTWLHGPLLFAGGGGGGGAGVHPL